MLADFWQMTAYRIAKRLSEKLNVPLTFNMVKEVELELVTVNNLYITKLYVGMINPQDQKIVVEEMRKLIMEKMKNEKT
jgi:hypothetical protein